ncbi:MAG: acetoin utilization protein AcuC, partial [Chloroflexota bacterium]|nr:acetoin utilization protein AcuC [Chloroflexota bacterium]
ARQATRYGLGRPVLLAYKTGVMEKETRIMPDTHHPHTDPRLMFDAGELHYDFGDDHPFQQRRLSALLDLLEKSDLWHSGDDRHMLPPRAATSAELELIHTHDYIAAVQRVSNIGIPLTDTLSPASGDALPHTTTDALPLDIQEEALKYGFGDGDTPIVPGMHQAAALIAGGTLVAMSAVMGLPEGGTFKAEGERPLHVFHPAGGLHHAWAERASGFCVYNDAAVAIAHVLRATEAKVLYIDFDGHHGDGVQRAFYDDPRVMTVSFHETGRYLFPGTGDTLELGKGLGRGYSVNVPLEPYTQDDSFSEAINTVLPPLALSFGPDVIISQHGCDTHAWDPLTHLELTLKSITAQTRLTHELAHSYCQGRWVALGGGGYDLYRVVPRAWSIVWAEMTGQPLPEALPEEWVTRWRPSWQSNEVREDAAQHLLGKVASGPAYFPATFQDRAPDFPPQARRWDISETNRRTVTQVRQLLLPPPLRQAFPPLRRPQSPMADMFDLLHPSGSATPSRSTTLATARGPLLLRDFCPLSLVERLKPDAGLRAFTRQPEREHLLLLSIAKSPDCTLTLAHTPEGVIVGEVTLAPGEGWWEGLDNVYEVTIEVSTAWRSLGIAQHMLAFALELSTLEDMILFAMGLSWHWDMEGLGISTHRYRGLIAALFGSQGFTEYDTREPNINEELGNILLVRIGKNVAQRDVKRFLNHL